MDWTISNEFKRKNPKKRARFGKSISEPNLSGFTPRFPDNLSHLIHEYVSVDELKFYRKKRPQNSKNDFHSKDSISLYDQSQPIIPFASLKSEYMREFGKIYSPRSRSVPNKINLNATTKELLDALSDDFSDVHFGRLRRGKSDGEIEKESVEDIKSTKETNNTKGQEETRPTHTFKIEGEISYSSDNCRGEFKGHSTMERSESATNPQMSNIKIHGNFYGRPEYNDSFKVYNHFTKSAPSKAKELCVSKAIVRPNIPPLSEYTDQFKELNLHSSSQLKKSKQLSNVTMRNNLMIGHSDQHVFPEYFESYTNPNITKLPERMKARSPILQMSGSMDYNPEYRVKFTEFPRRRPVTHKPETSFNFFERSRKSSSPVRQPEITTNYRSKPNVAIIEPTQNIHEPLKQDAFYLCQPEVRKARHEILIKKRPTSSRQIIDASMRNSGHVLLTNEDEENRSYNERSRIIKSPVEPPVDLTIETFHQTHPKAIYNKNPVKYGRRTSSMVDTSDIHQAKRNLSKIIEGNHEYATKNKFASLSSRTNEKKFINTECGESPSFVILKDPLKQNKWMQSSWYL